MTLFQVEGAYVLCFPWLSCVSDDSSEIQSASPRWISMAALARRGHYPITFVLYFVSTQNNTATPMIDFNIGNDSFLSGKCCVVRSLFVLF